MSVIPRRPIFLKEGLRGHLVALWSLGVSALLLAAGLSYAFGFTGKPPSNDPNVALSANSSSSTSSSTGSGSCDVTGVHVSYKTVYRVTPIVGNYVTSATVSNITWPSCNGATVAFSLTNSSNATIGTGSGPVAAPGNSNDTITSTTLTIGPSENQPLAHDVAGVSVTLTGGTTPIPPQCSGLNFSYTYVATNGNDNINGTNGNDLIYSLSGVDTIAGLEGNDCLNGGQNVGDNDTITDGNGADVVLAGDGNDNVTIGNGTDLVQLGNGSSTVTVGNGSDTITLGNGNNRINLGNGTDTVQVGTGTNTTYFGQGKTTFNASTSHDTCYVPHAAIKNDAIHNCTVVSQ